MLGMRLRWAPLLLPALRRARKFLRETFGLLYIEKDGETPVLAEIFLS